MRVWEATVVTDMGGLAALRFFAGIMVGLDVRTKDQHVFHLVFFSAQHSLFGDDLFAVEL